jgi:23S rRNA (cytosine1962-C5)-methyltransferase
MIAFGNRLAKVSRHLGKQAKRLGLSCYRLYDHDLPEFPFCIELYDGRLYIAEYKRRHAMSDEEHDEWMEKSLEVIIRILNISKDNVFLKLRQRKPGRLGQYQKLGAVQHEFIIEENGLKFIVNLSDYLDTGMFLDHRVTRQMVREQSRGKKVLNLFGYTGAFSVYAEAGGAVEVVTVDLSRTYLNWAERNFKLNGFQISKSLSGPGGIFIHADVKQYLKTIPPGYFDLVVLDPPTFSNSKRMNDFLDIQRDHPELINDCLKGMKRDGVLYFSTNYKKFILDNGKINASSIMDITKATTGFDFEGKLSRYCFKINPR